MLSKDGVADITDLKTVFPDEKRLNSGPVAIIECFQEIPCDPCYASCSKGAILPFENINDLPRMDFSLCDGCALCVAACPGIAIFVIDITHSDDKALLKLPYEFVPLPQKDETVSLLDRWGNIAADGKVIRCVKFRDKTSVVWVTAPKDNALNIRTIAPPAYERENPLRKPSA